MMYESLVTGIIASIFAVIIIGALNAIKESIVNRRKIDRNLDRMVFNIYEIEAKIGYPDDYYTILTLLRRNVAVADDTVDLMGPLVHCMHRKRRKMIFTLLCSIKRRSLEASTATVGRVESNEHGSRCKEIMGRIGYDPEHLPYSTLWLLVHLARNLNDGADLRSAALEANESFGLSERNLDVLRDRILFGDEDFLPRHGSVGDRLASIAKRIRNGDFEMVYGFVRPKCFTKEEYEAYVRKER